MAAAAARLHDGRWHFTGRQLYYAVCIALERPPQRAVATGEMGTGVLLITVGVIFLQVRVVFAVLAALGLLLLLHGSLMRWWNNTPPRTRPLALSWESFDAQVLAPMRSGERDLPAGLLLNDPPVGVAPASRAVVVCDRAETAGLLRANAAVAGIEAAVIVEGEPLPTADRVVALHDCDPSGCALIARLRAAGAADAVDAGLQPPVDAGEPLQLIEGAPARLPGELDSLLSDAEQGWLRDGQRLELATLSPEQIALRVRAALRQETRGSAA